MIKNEDKILILTSSLSETVAPSDRLRYVSKFCDSLSENLNGVKIFFATYDDLEIKILENKTEIYDTKNSEFLHEYRFVHFKNWVKNASVASAIARYLEYAGVAFYNTEVLDSPARSKISQMVALSQAGLNVPNSYSVANGQFKKIFDTKVLPVGFEFPVIFKDDNGAKGLNNYLLRNYQDGLDALVNSSDDTTFIMQEFLPNDGDYRFLFVGQNQDPMVFLRKGVGDSHLNNTSQGGSGELVDLDSIDPKVLSDAKKASVVLKREIGGVDILMDKRTGKRYILEVNQTPALATGYAVETKIKKFATLVKDILGE